MWRIGGWSDDALTCTVLARESPACRGVRDSIVELGSGERRGSVIGSCESVETERVVKVKKGECMGSVMTYEQRENGRRLCCCVVGREERREGRVMQQQ